MNPSEPLHNDAEPVAARSTVPIWLIMLCAGIFYWAALFLSDNAGGFSAEVYAPFQSYEQVSAANPQNPEMKMEAEGRKIFEATCAACHQSTGLGKEGTAPPLAGSEWLQADGGDRVIHIVLNGLTGPITVKGQQWNLSMVPWRDTFTDEQIAAVLTYERSHFDNHASPITPAMVKLARAQSHPAPETEAELLKLPLKP